MIPFFRKIRKKMADDNRPLKYARYAIGEIVLVVVGILIALQINTWNEERKTRKLEKELLTDLVEELKLDLENIKGSRWLSEASAKASFKVADALSNKMPFSDSLATQFSSITIPFFFSYNHATFENLKSEGFSIISDKYIRRTIQDLYTNKYEHHMEYMRFLNQEFLLTINNQQAKHLRAVTGNTPRNYLELQDNFEFINVLEDNAHNHEYMIENLDHLEKTIQKLIIDVEKHLAK